MTEKTAESHKKIPDKHIPDKKIPDKTPEPSHKETPDETPTHEDEKSALAMAMATGYFIWRLFRK